MKLSLIISSYNQCKRLRFCLQSALHQKLGPHATDYEVIVADDCSNDGTIEMIERDFNKVKVFQNPKPIANTYTLVENWNNAAQHATGERLIFSNGDIVYISTFIEAHADPTFWDQIIIGPAMRTTPEIQPYIEIGNLDYYKLMKIVSDNKWFTPDMRAGLIAHTYNKEEPPWHVYGYNFSLPRDYFKGVGGFTLKRAYGGEDLELAKKVVDAFGCKCLTNQNAMAFHLYHPQVNQHYKLNRDEYSF